MARARAAGAGSGDDPLTVDLESTVCETYGLASAVTDDGATLEDGRTAQLWVESWTLGYCRQAHSGE
jgi:hypothetical protein